MGVSRTGIILFLFSTLQFPVHMLNIAMNWILLSLSIYLLSSCSLMVTLIANMISNIRHYKLGNI